MCSKESTPGHEVPQIRLDPVAPEWVCQTSGHAEETMVDVMFSLASKTETALCVVRDTVCYLHARLVNFILSAARHIYNSTVKPLNKMLSILIHVPRPLLGTFQLSANGTHLMQ